MPSWPYSQLVPTFSAPRSAPRTQRGTRYYTKFLPRLKEVHEKLKGEEEKKWLEEKKAERVAITEVNHVGHGLFKRLTAIQHAKLCAKWLEDQREARTIELEDLRQARKDVYV